METMMNECKADIGCQEEREGGGKRIFCGKSRQRAAANTDEKLGWKNYLLRSLAFVVFEHVRSQIFVQRKMMKRNEIR